MKTSDFCPGMPGILFLLLLAVVFPGPLLAQSNSLSHKTFYNKFDNSTKYKKGVVVIKLKKGIKVSAQIPGDVFGITSLDAIAKTYSVSSVSKRFKHKPIDTKAGLPDLSRIYKIEFQEDIPVMEVVNMFNDDPAVEYAEPFYLGEYVENPNDPMFGSQQHLPQIMAPEAWDIHKGEDGDEVVVAIVDTGTDWLHPDLTENTWQNLGEDADGDGVTLEYNGSEWVRDPDDLNGIDDDGNGYVDDVIGWDFHEESTLGDGSNPDPLWYQGPYDHGTHCAGIAAGRTNNGVGISSVSWNIIHMPVQTDDGNNTVLYGYDGVIYAAENGADIISNSWTHGSVYSQAGNDAMQYAIGLGSIVCFASGNGNSSITSYPPGYDGVISVAAVNPNDTRASFTNYGISLDIAAPGVSILSSIPENGYTSWDGTSMATPMVAGLFGLLKSYQPDWTNEELIIQVLGTADDIDSINSGFENALGDGRINAYHALVDENVIPPQELKLELLSYTIDDENGNSMLEPNESATVSFLMRNFSQLVGSDAVTFSISSFDPDVTITNGTAVVAVPQDEEFELVNILEFSVNENASPHVVSLLVEINADVEVTYGNEFIISAIVSPSGFFVWDGELYGEGNSGSYIKAFLEDQGYEVMYTSHYPGSFAGFDGVFLSFGNGGENANEAIFFEYFHSLPIQEYLENGGNLYVEGMAVLGLVPYFGFPNTQELMDLFGVSNVTFGFLSNPISNLEGQDGTLAEGLTFTESKQANNWYIDKLIPASGANCPFYEDNYGNVAISYDGGGSHNAFYFGYALADLVDVDPLSSRYKLLLNTMDFFGYPYSSDQVIANFQVSSTDVIPGEPIQFTDFSIGADGNPVNNWAWDFDEDGYVDSYDQNPVWFYPSGGFYDVMLIASNGIITDTIVRGDLVMVRAGIFVYEGEEQGVDQSGAFIRDHLIDNGYEVIYSNRVPQSLEGFDAVFASFGSDAYTSPVLDNHVVNIFKQYITDGGNMYLEGSQALGNDQSGNVYLWFLFGLQGVIDGNTNAVEMLQGQPGTIMNGMEFSASAQNDVGSIDLYIPFPDIVTAEIAYVEEDYGAVAVQFDGTEYFGQKTFCMSYILEGLVDGTSPSTRGELINRVLSFFDITTSTNPSAFATPDEVKAYPNPAANHFTIEYEMVDGFEYEVNVYDLAGRSVLNQHCKSIEDGFVRIQIDVSDLESGSYFYHISDGYDRITGKLLIVR